MAEITKEVGYKVLEKLEDGTFMQKYPETKLEQIVGGLTIISTTDITRKIFERDEGVKTLTNVFTTFVDAHLLNESSMKVLKIDGEYYFGGNTGQMATVEYRYLINDDVVGVFSDNSYPSTSVRNLKQATIDTDGYQESEYIRFRIQSRYTSGPSNNTFRVIPTVFSNAISGEVIV